MKEEACTLQGICPLLADGLHKPYKQIIRYYSRNKKIILNFVTVERHT